MRIFWSFAGLKDIFEKICSKFLFLAGLFISGYSKKLKDLCSVLTFSSGLVDKVSCEFTKDKKNAILRLAPFREKNLLEKPCAFGVC